MTTTYSAEQTIVNAGTLLGANIWDSKLRIFQATVTLASQPIADVIELLIIPKEYRFICGLINSTVTLASATLAIGVSTSTGLYRTAATFTATDTPTLFGNNAAITTATADTQVQALVAADALPASGTVKIHILCSAV
jgi:hypothetical protein